MLKAWKGLLRAPVAGCAPLLSRPVLALQLSMERPPVVLDCGTGYLKLGLAGESLPCLPPPARCRRPAAAGPTLNRLPTARALQARRRPALWSPRWSPMAAPPPRAAAVSASARCWQVCPCSRFVLAVCMSAAAALLH